MKAWVLERQAKLEEQPLKLVEVPKPRPEPTELLIQVEVCGVCRTDIHIAEGDSALRKSPIILGHEIVGRVDEVGASAEGFRPGDRAGVFWLHSSCGQCRYCLSERESCCPQIQCTGWHKDGGYAEHVTVPAKDAIRLGDIPMESEKIAPLMCPRISGYAALQLTGAKQHDKLALYVFGPTAYLAIP